MGRMLTLCAVAIAAGPLGACATAIRGGQDAWLVNTRPAGAAVQTSNGLGCNATPCAIPMARRSAFAASITKPGYKTITVIVSHRFTAVGGAAFLDNAIIGGLAGATFDVIDGSTEDLAPNNLTLVLEREPAAPGAATAQSYTTNRMWTHDNPPPPATPAYGAGPAAGPMPAPASPAQGRTVALRVLPNGAVEDVGDTP